MNILLIHHKRFKNLEKQLNIINKYNNRNYNIYVWLNVQKNFIYDEIFLKIIKNYDLNIKIVYPKKYLSTASSSIKSAIGFFFNSCNDGLIIEDDCLFDESLFEGYYECVNIIPIKNYVLCFASFKKNSSITTLQISKHFIGWGWYSNSKIWKDFIISENKKNYPKFISQVMSLGILAVLYWTIIYILNNTKKYNSWDYDFYIFLLSNFNKYKIYCLNKNLISNVGADEYATKININDRELIYNKIDNSKIQNLNIINSIDKKYEIELEKKFYSGLFFKRILRHILKLNK